MSQTKALYRLQILDLDLDAQRKRLRAIKDQLEQDAVLLQAQAAVADVEGALHPKEARVKDLNLEIQTIVTQSKQFTDQLYGGGVSNPKVLQELEDKIAELKRRRADLENTLLETMMAADDLQAKLVEAQTALSEVQASRAAEHAGLRAEGRDLQTSIKALKAEREIALQHVKPDTLELYQEMRVHKQGRVVAPLDGDACSVCGVSQTTTLVQKVRQGQEMITCSNCRRILIAL